MKHNMGIDRASLKYSTGTAEIASEVSVLLLRVPVRVDKPKYHRKVFKHGKAMLVGNVGQYHGTQHFCLYCQIYREIPHQIAHV